MPRRFPDLVCIGAQKAATTWFYEVLKEHPQFYVPLFKELHYFTQLHNPEVDYAQSHRADRVDRIRRNAAAKPGVERAQQRLAEAELLAMGREDVDDDWYASIFGRASSDQICVDTCPSYLHLHEPGVKHVLRLNPSVKLVLFVRDPVERAWSHIRMKIAQGDANSEINALLEGRKPMHPYLKNSDYRSSISLWRRLSEPCQLSTFLYDEVEADPLSVLSRVCEMVGLSAPGDFGHVNKKVFEGSKLTFPKELRAVLLENLAPQYDYLSEEFPGAVTNWRAKHMAAMLA
jgi:hypothetical protein